MKSAVPGLTSKTRRNGARVLYWKAAHFGKAAAEYPDQLIRLPDAATDAEIADICARHTARLNAWIAERAPTAYDGTIGSLCGIFERHELSPIRDVQHNTADSYRDALKVVRTTISDKRVREIVPIEAKRWVAQWSAPIVPGEPPRLRRAHGAISMVRQILRFGFSIGHRECGDLANGLASMRFDRAPPRRQELTRAHAQAFIAAALEANDPNMAIGIATQFELMVRQKDVIGSYSRDGIWTGSFTWENIKAGGIWRLVTSKTSAEAEYDLKRYDMLWPLLQAVPQSYRTGAIVKDRSGKAIEESQYRKKFRAIADMAGIPKEIRAMDARAGAVTEAFEAGATGSDVSRAATHANEEITNRIYRRRNAAAIASVADIRRRSI